MIKPHTSHLSGEYLSWWHLQCFKAWIRTYAVTSVGAIIIIVMSVRIVL